MGGLSAVVVIDSAVAAATVIDSAAKATASPTNRATSPRRRPCWAGVLDPKLRCLRERRRYFGRNLWVTGHLPELRVPRFVSFTKPGSRTFLARLPVVKEPALMQDRNRPFRIDKRECFLPLPRRAGQYLTTPMVTCYGPKNANMFVIQGVTSCATTDLI